MANDADRPDDSHARDEKGAGGNDDGDGSAGNGDKDGDAGSTNEPVNKKRNLFQRPGVLIGLAVGAVVLLVGGLLWWLHARQFESTDDAFVDVHIVHLAPQVTGRVTSVLVNDNQAVEAGQELIEIDSSTLQTGVAQARAQKAQAVAQVQNATAQIDVSRAGYEQAMAEAAAAQAVATNAAREVARFESLQALNPAAVADQQFEQARTTAAQSAAQADSARKVVATRAAQITAARTQVEAGAEQVNAAQAQLDTAGINLGYARIVAPVAGHVAQATVAIGDYVQPGTQLLAIVPADLWITANFKETQLALMRVGQHVVVKVDACAGEKIEGHVDSIQRGAGQAFGILPPENASGNFVKVVQRVPVKIVFDNPPPDCPLGPGMSVEPTVRVR